MSGLVPEGQPLTGRRDEILPDQQAVVDPNGNAFVDVGNNRVECVGCCLFGSDEPGPSDADCARVRQRSRRRETAPDAEVNRVRHVRPGDIRQVCANVLVKAQPFHGAR